VKQTRQHLFRVIVCHLLPQVLHEHWRHRLRKGRAHGNGIERRREDRDHQLRVGLAVLEQQTLQQRADEIMRLAIEPLWQLGEELLEKSQRRGTQSTGRSLPRCPRDSPPVSCCATAPARQADPARSDSPFFCRVMKSGVIAYGLWLLSGFGVLGLHHLYLGDDRKAFLWLVTGGGFGLAALRDLFMIPRYCRDVVDDQTRRKSFPLLGGAFVFSYFFGRVAVLALCNPMLLEENEWVAVVVRAVACGVAAHLTVSSGNRAVVSFLPIVAVSAVCQAVILLLPPMETYHWASYIPSVQTVGALSAAAAAYRKRDFRHTWKRSESYLVVRVLRIAVGGLLVLAFVGLAVLLNARITEVNTNGEERTVKYHYLHEIVWDEASWDTFVNYLAEWIVNMEEIRRFTADEVDEASAYAIMGLKEGASMGEVKKRFRVLAKEMHPDHVRGTPAEIKASADKFAKMQTAYHLLVEKHGRDSKSRAPPH
jgi:DnaJ family protein C protein 22